MTGRDDYFEVTRTVQAQTGVASLRDIEYLQSEPVRRLAALVESDLRDWLGLYPLSSVNRVQAMALTCSAMCVDIGFDAALTSARITILMFAIDDVVDGTFCVPDDAQADALLVTCGDLALARGDVDVDERERLVSPPLGHEIGGPWKSVAVAFQAFCRDLSRMTGAGQYYHYFAQKFVAMTDGMRVELLARRRFIETAAVPDFDEYYHNGQRSVGAPAVFGSTLVASAPRVGPEEWKAVESLIDDYLWTAGGCIRLTNDVRSHARELEIEQRPSSVTIKMISNGLSETAAEAEVIRIADQNLAALPGIALQMPLPLRDWVESVRRFTSVIRDWYMLRELHEQKSQALDP